MTMFEPLVNLLVVMTVLSFAAERLTNVWKLQSSVMRVPSSKSDEEKQRESSITWRSILIGFGVAVVMKADIFELMTHLEAPWDTLGWVVVQDGQWVRVPAAASFGTAAYAIGGSLLTGLGLGFGSKFWHELLDMVLEVRNYTKALKEKTKRAMPDPDDE